MRLQILLLLILQNNAEEEIINCAVEKRLKVTRNNTDYKLQLCTSINNCTKGFGRPCDFCMSIPGVDAKGCNSASESCEGIITSFLNDSCKLNDTSNHQITCTSSIQHVTPTPSTIVTTVTNSIESPSCPKQYQALEASVAVLGAVIVLLLVILALVSTGWVWTYWTMKKKNKRTRLCTKCQEQESEEKQFCPNQIHEMTTTQPVVGTAIEQLLDSLEESGQSNNGLSSKDNKGYHDVKRVENIYTSSEGSTQSSLQEEQAVNRVEEGESGEKHVYHVLEKPGGDDYEDPDKDLEENIAMEYETPVPLN